MLLLNCDLGEGFGRWQQGQDDKAMRHIDIANIACGFHAGDPLLIQQTLTLAKKYGVKVSAHPSYPDLVGFGRRSMQIASAELYAMIQYQIAAMAGMAATQGLTIEYVKPHGALYNDMMKESRILSTIMHAVSDFHLPLTLVIQADSQQSEYLQQAQALGLPLYFEAFADRRYLANGALQPRSEHGAVLKGPQILAQVKQLLETGTVTSASGQPLALNAQTLCVHGDNDAAIDTIEQIKLLIKR
ncbi:5-oxoprolinase subunit PxpA [Thalassotalea aquiviva]|uniref:5-oxoprolinase subunit PxpA n=1 Tax=Thalassotalea aquiviva TaxID=3242415 RepID=UPI003529E11F